MKKSKGFTLIELLVVIAIIALLLSVVMPALRKAKEKARFVICATRQRSILTAINAYRSDNGMKLPPTSQNRDDWYTIPNRLKYYYDPRRMGKGAVMEVLGDYMKDATYFNCPLSPQNPDDLQRVIDDLADPTVSFLNCSYYLLWNWKLLYDNIEKPFRPTDDGGHTLMLCDMLMGPEPYNGNLWISSHPFKNAYKHDFLDAVTNMKEKYWAKPFVYGDRPEMKMNAGYLDGRVVTMSSLDYYQWGSQAGIWLLPYPFR